MQMIENVDGFIHRQPQKNFTNTLCSPVHFEKPVGFSKRKRRAGEVLFDKVKLLFQFPDDENLLEYAYGDFRNFLRSVDVAESNDGLCIKLKRKIVKKNVPEAFLLDVSKSGCTICANATEGIRRALIFIEDEMKRRSGPFLPMGKTVKIPLVETRISRCFFTPPSHASAEGAINELCSDIDYYPDEYLNRLAHDGINGLWIGSSFKKMLKSNLFPEYGTEQDIQIKKLNQIVQKCKRFGIGIYLFVTEPASSCYSKEIFNHPDMLGPTTPPPNRIALLCPSTKKVQEYVKEAVTNLFTLVPDLAGLINITVGESLSGCGSTAELFCPRCKKTYKTLAATLTATEKMFSDALKEIAPQAKFISWTYAQRSTDFHNVEEACRLRDKGVIHMQNFEDLGTPVQLGKKRLACDYWLSYAGPGKLMKRSAEINKERNVPTFAKIQACSSHEISTVPYIPVPGILFDKYQFMHENGIVGVLQCWYFGNYPSLMNKSAHELAFTPYFSSKDEFLVHLAKTYFGKDYLNAVKAWKFFEKGYKNFPTNTAFEWFGPMQDSPCRPLHLLPIDWPLPGTWLKSEYPGGDRIGECLLNGHTIDEAIILVERMCRYWEKGIFYMKKIPLENSEVRSEQIRNATAIELIFKSGLNTLKFYKLRHLLGTCQGGLELLNQMKQIVYDEIEIGSALFPLAEVDNRIGYHSEANGYKIFPEKLKWRIQTLRELLKTDFQQVEERLHQKELPLPFYYGLTQTSVRKIISSNPREEDWDYFYLKDGNRDDSTALRVFEKDGVCCVQLKVLNLDSKDEIEIKPEFHIMFPTVPIKIIHQKFTIEASNTFSVPKSKVAVEKRKFKFSREPIEKGYIYSFTFTRKTMRMTETEPFRLGVWRKCTIESTLLPASRYFLPQLIRGEFSPDSFCFFIKE